MASGKYEIELQNLAAQKVAALRYRTTPEEFSAHMAQALKTVFGTLSQAGVNAEGPPFARYLDRGEGYIDLEVGFPIAGELQQTDRVEPQVLPEGPAAATCHVGPYNELGEAHAALAEWVREKGHTPSGNPFEIYITDPGQVKDPAEYRTMVYLPVAS